MSVEPNRPAGTPSLEELYSQRIMARTDGDNKALVVASRALWRELMARGEHDRLVADLEDERGLGKAEGNSAYEALCMSTLGLVHSRQRAHNASEDCFRAAIRMYRALGDEAEVAGVRYHLGCLYAQNDRKDDARQHFQAALSTFREKKMGSWFAQSNLRLADSYAPGEPQHIRHLKDALGVFAGAKQERDAASTAARLADSYARAGDKKTAEQMYFEAAKLYEKLGDAAGHAHILARNALFFSHHNRDREAEFYYGQALAASRESGQPHLAALCDAGIALSWDRLSVKSSSRDSILGHGVTLLLPATLYLGAAITSTRPGAEAAQQWATVGAAFVSWCVSASRPDAAKLRLRHQLEKYAADRGWTLSTPDDGPARVLRRRRVTTPDITAQLAQIHPLISRVRPGTALTVTVPGGLDELEHYADLARRRYSPPEPPEADSGRGGSVS